MLLLIKKGCYLGLLPGGDGEGMWEGGFCWGFFAWIWEAGTEMVGQIHDVYIHSLSPISRMGTWCQIMYDGAIKWRQIRSKSRKILSHLCRDRDETTLNKPNAFAFAETVTFSQDPQGFQLPPPHINFLHLYPSLSGSGCLWPWYPRQALTANLITPVNETSYSISSTFGNLLPLPLPTFCPN